LPRRSVTMVNLVMSNLRLGGCGSRRKNFYSWCSRSRRHSHFFVTVCTVDRPKIQDWGSGFGRRARQIWCRHRQIVGPCPLRSYSSMSRRRPAPGKSKDLHFWKPCFSSHNVLAALLAWVGYIFSSDFEDHVGCLREFAQNSKPTRTHAVIAPMINQFLSPFIKLPPT